MRARQRLGPKRLVIAAWLIFTVVALGLWAGVAYSDYRRAFAHGTERTRYVARLLDEHARRSVFVTQQMLHRVLDTLQPAGIRLTSWSDPDWDRVAQLAEGVPSVSKLLVLDENGRVLYATRTKKTEFGTLQDWVLFPRLRETLDDFLIGPPAEPVAGTFVVTRSLLRDGRFAGAAVAVVDGGYFKEMAGRLQFGEQGVIALLHDEFGPLALHPEGWKASPLEQITKGLTESAGVVEAVFSDAPALVAYQRLGELPLVALAGQPHAAILHDWLMRTGWFTVLVFGSIAGFGGFTWATCRGIDRETVTRGELQSKNHRLAELVEERGALLQEIHHRVKNNLQIIASLLTLESARMPGGRTAFADTMARIQAMALVHQLMYESADVAHVDAGAYLAKLARALGDSADTSVLAEVEPLPLDIDRAVPLAMLVNEAVSNAIKHGGGGPVRIVLRRQDGDMLLEVCDQGPGFPPGFRPGEGNSLGMRLMQGLAAQLGAEIAFENRGGGVVRVTAPLGPI